MIQSSRFQKKGGKKKKKPEEKVHTNSGNFCNHWHNKLAFSYQSPVSTGHRMLP